MNIQIRISLTCFFGALIGALTALQLNPNLWWIGIIIGGLMGYVGYDYKEFFSTLRSMGRKIPWISEKIIIGAGFVAGFCILLIGLGIALLSLQNTVNLCTSNFHTGIDPFGWKFYIIGTVVQTTLGFLFAYGDGAAPLRWKIGGFVFSPIGNIIAVPILVIALVVILCVWLYLFIIRALTPTFRMIHSDIRLLCMIDAGLGSLIGWYCGNAIIGSLAGAAIGFVHYKLTTVYMAKFAPSN